MIIEFKVKDLSEEKQRELKEYIPDVQPDDYVFSLQIFTGNDLNVDVEQARIEKELDNPTTH